MTGLVKPTHQEGVARTSVVCLYIVVVEHFYLNQSGLIITMCLLTFLLSEMGFLR